MILKSVNIVATKFIAIVCKIPPKGAGKRNVYKDLQRAERSLNYRI